VFGQSMAVAARVKFQSPCRWWAENGSAAISAPVILMPVGYHSVLRSARIRSPGSVIAMSRIHPGFRLHQLIGASTGSHWGRVTSSSSTSNRARIACPAARSGEPSR